jgi:hypothetical protein
MIPQYIQEIIQAGKFLEEHPDWKPNDVNPGAEAVITTSTPATGIGLIVQLCSGPNW